MLGHRDYEPPSYSVLMDIVWRTRKYVQAHGQLVTDRVDMGPFYRAHLGKWTLAEFSERFEVQVFDGPKKMLSANIATLHVSWHMREIAELLPLLQQSQILDDLAEV